MSSDPLDMTGLWEGTYVYPGYVGRTTPFVAFLADHGGHLTGTIMEPSSGEESIYTEEIEAHVSGARGGRAVDFIKVYDGQIWEHSVDYVGQLSADGQTVTGMWSVDHLDGTFEMHRDLSMRVEEEVEEEVELSVPAGPAGLQRDGPGRSRGR